MGLLRTESDRSWLKQKGSAMLGIVGLHVVAIGALMHMGVIHVTPEPEPVAIKIAFLNDKPPEAPRPEQPRLEPLPAVVMPPSLVDIPIDLPPPPTAITVVARAEPPAPPAAPMQSIDTDTPIPVDSVDYLYQEPLRYPPQAKSARAQGIVYLQVVIDREGLPREVRVHRSSGFQSLDGAACDAVRKFRFRPYRENGVTHVAQVIVPIQFSLTGRGMRDKPPGRDRHGEHGDERS
jgi:protein TonB